MGATWLWTQLGWVIRPSLGRWERWSFPSADSLDIGRFFRVNFLGSFLWKLGFGKGNLAAGGDNKGVVTGQVFG